MHTVVLEIAAVCAIMPVEYCSWLYASAIRKLAHERLTERVR